MTIKVAAPGKMILVGEYAVLHGAPALVSAINREAIVCLDSCSAMGIIVDAPDVGLHDVPVELRDGVLQLIGGQRAPESLKVVASVFESFSKRLEPRFEKEGLRVTIDSSGFVQNENGFKLGLGSSAAVTVALTRAVLAYLEIEGEEIESLALFKRAQKLHRAMQGGVGSGLDIAASVFGGLVVFDSVRAGETPLPKRIEELVWPPMAPVFVGKSASTPELVQKVHSYRRANPVDFQSQVDEMARVSEAVIAASRAGELGSIRQGCSAYCELMQRLGEASGAEIISDVHRRVRDAAAEKGFDYKPSGAGGGDLGLIFGETKQALEDFRPLLEQLGASWTELGISSTGVRLVKA